MDTELWDTIKYLVSSIFILAAIGTFWIIIKKKEEI